MARFQIIVAMAIAVLQYAAALECSKANEESRCVAECPPEKTCRTRDIQVSCLQSATENCKDACVCKQGYFRDDDGECVTEEECPCNPDEIKDDCPVDCPSDYCPKTEPKSVSCPTPDPCPKPQCKCRFNYRRAENGTCIPTRDCPEFECKKPFEEANMCPPICPNGSCGQATPTGRCPAIFGRIGIVLICNPQCRCKEGYWWDENKVCVPYDQCPGKSNQTSTTSSPVTNSSSE